MNILFICQRFYKTNPTSLCVWAVVKKFVERGHNCRIITQAGLVFDSHIGSELKNSTDLETEPVVGFIKRLFDYLNYYRTWPYETVRFNEKLYHRTKAEIEKEKPDVVISSYNYLDALVVGHKVKEEYGDRIVYVPYFLDGMLAGPSMWLMSKKEHDKRSIEVENQLLSNADMVVMMKSAKTKYEEEKEKLSYFDKIIYLDLPLYEVRQSKCKRQFFPEGQTVLFFSGSMPKHIRDPKYILKVFNGIENPNIHFYIAGTSSYMKDLKNAAKKDSRIHILGLIPHDDVCQMQMEADVLVNIGNTLSNMMPSKVFEYMSTGKKIIMTYRLENDPSIPYMKHYGRALMLDERKKVSVAVNQTTSFVLDSNVEKFKINSDELYDNTPESFTRTIESIYELVNK